MISKDTPVVTRDCLNSQGADAAAWMFDMVDMARPVNLRDPSIQIILTTGFIFLSVFCRFLVKDRLRTPFVCAKGAFEP